MSVRLLEFTEEQSKPPFLYHGSPHKVEILKPNLAQGFGERASDRFNAIYASDLRIYAIVFALTIYPNQSGLRSWSLSYTQKGFEVIIEAGNIDLTRKGYLYRLPSDTFRQVSRYQWVSDIPVRPLDYEIITATDYIHSFVTT